MSLFDTIQKPTLLLDSDTARANIRRMARKAQRAGVLLRPHFKTHQSLTIGEWFRAEGVSAITVSSLDMAEYFASGGWNDITLAFPANLRQISGLDGLAARVRLGLLVESVEAVRCLGEMLTHTVDIWIKVDVGAGRTGLAWNHPEAIQQVAGLVNNFAHLQLRGLLTHAGHTYHANGPDEICRIYSESTARMDTLRRALAARGVGPLQISVGDTPGCSVCDSFGAVDEIRPGNFVFYDTQQTYTGACQPNDIAVALACPVVALHPERSAAVIYGGAIHLSKDYIEDEGFRRYGLVALPENDRWGSPLPGAYVSSLSQEHGILHLEPDQFSCLKVGDLVCILPAHSCLTATCMGRYQTLDGQFIEIMPAF